MLSHTLKWSFSPPVAESMRGIFSQIYCKNLVKLLEVKLTEVWWSPHDWVRLKFLTLSLVHTDPQQLQFRFYFQHRSPLQFPLCFGKPYLPVFTCLSVQRRDSSLPCILPSLINWRRVADFLICSAFYLLLGHSGNFQTLYVRNWKPESIYTVLKFIFYLVFKLQYCFSRQGKYHLLFKHLK